MGKSILLDSTEVPRHFCSAALVVRQPASKNWVRFTLFHFIKPYLNGLWNIREIGNKNKPADKEQTETECTTELYVKAKAIWFCFGFFFRVFLFVCLFLLLLSPPSVLHRLQTETQALLGSSVTTSATSQTSKTQPHAPSDTLTRPPHTSHIDFSCIGAARLQLWIFFREAWRVELQQWKQLYMLSAIHF